MENGNAVSATLFHASLLQLSRQDHRLIGINGGCLSYLLDEFLQSVVEDRSVQESVGADGQHQVADVEICVLLED